MYSLVVDDSPDTRSVEEILDEINEIASVLSYVPHRVIQEDLCLLKARFEELENDCQKIMTESIMPCKTGDTLYYVRLDKKHEKIGWITKLKVLGIHIADKSSYRSQATHCKYVVVMSEFGQRSFHLPISCFGKTLFKTEAEARAMIAEFESQDYTKFTEEEI